MRSNRPAANTHTLISAHHREIGNEVLLVEGISVKPSTVLKVLDNVSFIVNREDKIAFVGSNELAKTTLFKIITGEMEPDEGTFTSGVLPQASPISRKTIPKFLIQILSL